MVVGALEEGDPLVVGGGPLVVGALVVDGDGGPLAAGLLVVTTGDLVGVNAGAIVGAIGWKVGSWEGIGRVGDADGLFALNEGVNVEITD